MRHPIRKEAIDRAKEYLPENATFEKFELYFIPLPRNAKIDLDRALCDPLLALDLGKESLVSIASHLVHHIGRDSVAEKFDLDSASSIDSIIEKFIILEMEGIANCVSNVKNLPMMKRLKDFRERIGNEFEGYLEVLQELYLGYHQGNYEETDLASLKKKTWLLNSLLIPAGCRMAYEIESAFDRETLINTVGSPAKFLKMYQKAAEKNNLFLFEEITLKYLEEDLSKRRVG